MESLDLRGLKCPLPALFARRALERAPPGTRIEILTDDPMAPIDVPHMCRAENFELIALERDGDTARMILQRPISAPAEADPDGPGHPPP